MARAQGDDDSAATGWSINGRPASSMAKAGLIPFFVMHYGMFWVVHGVFVFTLPLFASFGTDGPDIGPAPDVWTILLAVVALFISHGLSYLFNYIGSGEYLRVSPVGPDVRAVRAPGRPARDDHLRRDRDLDDRGAGGRASSSWSCSRPPWTSRSTCASIADRASRSGPNVSTG